MYDSYSFRMDFIIACHVSFAKSFYPIKTE